MHEKNYSLYAVGCVSWCASLCWSLFETLMLYASLTLFFCTDVDKILRLFPSSLDSEKVACWVSVCLYVSVLLLSLWAKQSGNHLICAEYRVSQYWDGGGGRGCLQETSSLISVGSPGIKMASRRGGDGSGVGGGRGGTRWVFLDR